MRNSSRQSYLHSNIKEDKKPNFWFKKKREDVAEEVLGNQFQMPPMVNAPQNFVPQTTKPNFPNFNGNMPPVMPPMPSVPQGGQNPFQVGGQGVPFQTPIQHTSMVQNANANAVVANEKENKKKKKKEKKQNGYYFQSTLATFWQWIRLPNIAFYFSVFLILPILFLISLFMDNLFAKYAYIVGTIIAVIWMVWKKTFSEGIRLTLCVSYVALSAIIIVNVVTGLNPRALNNASKPMAINTIANPGKTMIDISDFPSLPTEIPQPSPTIFVGDDSETQRNFEGFMAKWQNGDIEGMLEFIAPSWKKQQKDPVNALFTLLLNRRPKAYTIESISGTENDSSRQVTMTAEINKFTTDEYLKIRFQILMLKEQEIWYVDPSSLGTNFQPTPTPDPRQTPTPTVAPRTTVTPKPPEDTPLYYNSNGGKRYHIDPNCSSVNKKYLPLTPFSFGQLGHGEFKDLIPCPVCNAPN